jgi:hypothetical protein
MKSRACSSSPTVAERGWGELPAGRTSRSTKDVRSVVKAVLRHRVLLGFEGLSEGITTDQVVDDVLSKLPVPAEAAAAGAAR